MSEFLNHVCDGLRGDVIREDDTGTSIYRILIPTLCIPIDANGRVYTNEAITHHINHTSRFLAKWICSWEDMCTKQPEPNYIETTTPRAKDPGDILMFLTGEECVRGLGYLTAPDIPMFIGW